MWKLINSIDREYVFTLLDDPRSELIWYGPGLFAIEIQRWKLPDNRIIELEIARTNEPIIIWIVK